jgi:hypothetical protein
LREIKDASGKIMSDFLWINFAKELEEIKPIK